MQDNVLYEREQVLHKCQLLFAVLLSHDSWTFLYWEDQTGISTMRTLSDHFSGRFPGDLKYCQFDSFSFTFPQENVLE